MFKFISALAIALTATAAIAQYNAAPQIPQFSPGYQQPEIPPPPIHPWVQSTTAALTGMGGNIDATGFVRASVIPPSPVVQALTDHGTPNSTHGNGTQKCVWPFTAVQDFRGVTGTAVGAGDAVVGYVHTSSTGGTPMYPQSVTDNAGNIYTLSPGILWSPYPEDIGIWYLSNIQGNPNTFTFDYTQYLASGNRILDFCDVGFVEYTGVIGISPVVNPFNAGAVQTPSLTISLTVPSLIWTLGATNTVADGSDLLTPGYSMLIAGEQARDGIGVWGSNSTVPSGALTLTWNNSYYNANGLRCRAMAAFLRRPCKCGDGTPAGSTGCTTVISAVALSAPPVGF
jgi:hypothetical protein